MEPTNDAAREAQPKTRVTCFLPCNDYRERQALLEIIDDLESRRPSTGAVAASGTSATPVTGFTHNEIANPVFRGYWHRKGQWVQDRVALFVIDFEADIEDRSLAATLNEFQADTMESYRNNNSAQAALWVIKERIVRHLARTS